MVDVDLSAKFPDLRPDRSIPPVRNILGFGLFLYGDRDYDLETESFVRTLWLCVLYFPLFALRAYRTAPGDQGWVVLGREPLSTGAKLSSLMLVLLASFGGGYSGYRAYTTT